MVNQKYNEAFRGVCFLRIREKKLSVKSRTRSCSRPQSKGLQYGRREGKDQEKKKASSPREFLHGFSQFLHIGA